MLPGKVQSNFGASELAHWSVHHITKPGVFLLAILLQFTKTFQQTLQPPEPKRAFLGDCPVIGV